MYVYEIEGYFNDNKFNFNINKFPVISYKQNDYIKYNRGISISEDSSSSLDNFKIGLLDSKQPEVSIMTTHEDKIEQYKNEIIRKIKNTLKKRKNLVESQLQILDNYKFE